MVARTDDLVVKIAADITELRRGLRESVKVTKTASQRMKKAIASIGGVLRKVAKLTAGVTLGFGYFMKRVIDSGDRIGKLSARLKVSTEFLSEYGHVANLAGTSLESVAKGVQFMQKAIGEAKIGLGEGKRALEELGFSVNSFAKLSSEEQFDAITNAISGLNDQTLKLAVTQKIFGRSGVELLNIMNQTPEAIRKSREEAKRLGLSLSGVTAKAMEEFNDNLTRFTGFLKGTGIRVFTQYKDQLIAFTKALTSDEVIQGFNNFIDKLIKIGLELGKIAKFALAAANDIGKVIDFVKDLNEKAEKFDLLGSIVDFQAKQIEKLRDLAMKLGAKIGEKLNFSSALKEGKTAVKEFQEAIDQINIDIPMTINRPRPEFDREDILKQFEIPEMEGVEVDLSDIVRIKKTKLELKDILEIEEMDFSPHKAKIQEGLEDLFANLPNQMNIDTELRSKVTFGELLENADVTLKKITRQFEINTSDWSDSLAEGILRGESAFKTLRSTALQVLNDITSAVLKSQVTDPLVNTLVGGLKASTGGGFFSSLFGGFKADGGNVSAGKSYVVGERGAELFMPNRSGTIIPNDGINSGGNTKNITVNQTNNFSLGVEETIRARILEAVPAIQSSTKNAVFEEIERGGTAARRVGR